MTVNLRQKIIALWTVFLLGTLFHAQLGLMPLFHGLSVMESQKATTISDISGIMGVIHFGLTVFYSMMNLLHVVLYLLVGPIFWYQIALIVLLFGIGLLLNFVAFQWMRSRDMGDKRMSDRLTSSHY